jgi:hypothetical protein
MEAIMITSWKAGRVLFFAFVSLLCGAFFMTGCTLRHTYLLTAFSFICVGDFIFNEDRFEWAFWNAGTTIDACIGVDIEPGPLFDRLARYDALNWAYLDAPRISETQTSDNVSH